MKKEWETMSREELLKEADADREFHLIPDGEGTYIGIWPELPGCASCGATMQETLQQGLLAKKAWFKALMLKAVSAEDLQHLPAYEQDNPDEVMEQVRISQPSADELAIKDTLVNEGDCILLVEDTAENLALLEQELSEEGFDYEEIHPELPVSGILVNLYFEVYAYDRNGIRIAEPFRGKGISYDDFLHVADIYSRNGSLTEGISEVDQAELDRIYRDPEEDMTFGELLEQLQVLQENAMSQTVQLHAGPVSFTVPEEWESEPEADGSGFFCTDEDKNLEFSAYYLDIDLSSYSGPEEVFRTLQQHYRADENGPVLLSSEPFMLGSRSGIRFLFTDEERKEITRIVILNGTAGLLQMEYQIPASQIAYLSEIVETAAESAEFEGDNKND